MNNRSRKILNMVVTAENKKLENDNYNPASFTYNIKQYRKESSISIVIQQDTLSNDSFDTNSIPDSQDNISLSLFEDEDDDIQSAIGRPSNKMPFRVVEQSNSFSDTRSDSNSDSSDSTTSNSTPGDFFTDDSVKDPNFQPNKRCIYTSSSESEEDIQPKLTGKLFDISPQPGPSNVKHKSFNDNILPHVTDTQPPSIDTQQSTVDIISPIGIDIQPALIDTQPFSIDTDPPSIDTQPPSADSQAPSVGGRLLCRKRKANPESWKRNRTKFLRNSGKAYTSMSKSKKLFNAREMGPICPDKCKLKCSQEFSFEQRLLLFKNYWQTGDLEVQRQFINNNMTKIVPKYRYVRVGSTRNF